MMVLITGVAGFLGASLAKKLLTAGHEVHGIDLVPREAADPGLASYRIASITDIGLVPKGTDVVFHLAAMNDLAACELNPYACVRDNVLGTSNVLEQAWHERARVLFATTSSTLDPRATGFYPTSKLCGELLVNAWRARGVEVAVARYWNVYGPGQRASSVVPRFTSLAAAGEVIKLWADDHRNGRDFVHVEDLNDWHTSLLENGAWKNGEHCIGSGTVTSVRELADLCAALAGAPAPVIAKENAPTPPVSPYRTYVRAEGFRPRVKLVDGLKRLIEEERARVKRQATTTTTTR